MKRIFLLVCVLMFVQLGQAVSQTVSCESVEDENWWGSIGRVKTCHMEYTTTIDSDAVSVSPPDSTVLGLSFWDNKKISSLPIKLDETYPNLVAYATRLCSVKTVSKINFRNLNQLKQLYLSSNQIETIASDTFEDLTSLEFLNLNYNKIKKMNGATFGKLNKLTQVWLNANICIDKGYYDEFVLADLVKDVNEKCAFEEPEASLSTTNETTSRIESTNENREISNEGSTLSSDQIFG